MAEAKYTQDELFKIRQEIQLSEKVLESDLKPIIQENLERYTGFFIPPQAVNWDVIINEFYAIGQYNLPSTFFRNPRAFLKPRNKTFIIKQRDPITGEMTQVQADSTKSAKTQEQLINYIMSEIKYKREVRRVLFDASITAPYGVLWHGYKGEFGMTEEQSIFIRKHSLFVKRLSPLRFVWDPAVTIANIDEGRWVGRSFDIPLQDLLEDDTLEVDRKFLKGKVGYGQRVREETKQNGTDILSTAPISGRTLSDFADKKFKDSPLSRFVTIYEIFQLPSKRQAREGEKGKVWLLTEEQEKPLRVSKWPYKAEGWPCEILQVNEVQDSMLGLDDFSTYKHIADQGNIIKNLQLENAKQLNRAMIAVSKDGLASEEDQEKIRQGKNKIIMYDGETVAGKIAVVSAAGGASSELYLLDQRIDLKLDRVSGVSDLKTGIPPKSGEESATSIRERSSGGQARPLYRQDIMSDFLKASIHKLNQYNKQFMTIEEAVRVIGSLDIQWSDNPTQEEIQADTDVEIDVTSMLPENPQQELEEQKVALGLALQAVQDPTGKVREKLAQEGYTFEIAPLIETILMRLKIRNPDVFRRLKPEESEGYVSVAEVRAAKANVQAALAGQQPPNPPAPENDHVARMETYQTILGLIQPEAPDSVAVQILTQLVQMHQELLQAIQEKQAQAGQKIDKSAFGVKMVGV
jgi:hypothetical protein